MHPLLDKFVFSTTACKFLLAMVVTLMDHYTCLLVPVRYVVCYFTTLRLADNFLSNIQEMKVNMQLYNASDQEHASIIDVVPFTIVSL